MKIAIVGSRDVYVDDIGKYIPENTSVIVSGGAKGIDMCTREYASSNGIQLVEFLPDYKRYGRGAPIVRNKQIVDYSDRVIAFWNARSRGTKNVIEYCKKIGKDITIIQVQVEQ